MLTLINRKKNSVFSHRVAHLGIDIGSYSTKVVRYLPNSEREFSCVEFLTGVPPNVGQDEQGPSGELAIENVEAPPVRRGNDQSVDISRWSKSQLDALAGKIAAAVGPLTRAEVVQATFSMAACDLRALQLRKGETPQRETLRKQIVELTGDTRARSISIVKMAENANNTKVVSVPEELVDGIAVSMDRSKCTPQYIEAAPWSMVRTLPTGTSAITLDLGYSEPTIVAHNSDGIQYIRRMKWGGFSKIIAPTMERLGLNVSQASRLFQESMTPNFSSTLDPDLVDEIRVEFGERVRETCQRLSREIDSAVEFISWKFDGFSKDSLYVQGGVAEHACIFERLQQELDLDVKRLEDETRGITSRYTKAAGLAGWRFQV